MSLRSEVKYDRHYSENPASCGEPFPEFVAFAQQHGGPGVEVLDLGCGQGRDALVFARQGCTVLGVDISAVGIAQMCATGATEGLQVQGETVDVESFEPQQSFDIVIMDRVLHMLSSDEARLDVLLIAIKATRSGGHLLVADGPKHRTLIRSTLLDQGWKLIKDTRNRCFGQKP